MLMRKRLLHREEVLNRQGQTFGSESNATNAVFFVMTTRTLDAGE